MDRAAAVLASWDTLPVRLDEVREATGIAEAPVEPVKVADLDKAQRRELGDRLHALGFVSAPTIAVGKLRRGWRAFAEAIDVDGARLTPEGWERLLQWTVLERTLPPWTPDDALGTRARGHRMAVLGFASFDTAPRFPGLYITLRDLGVPGSALGPTASATSDAWVAELLADLDRLAQSVVAHLDAQTPARKRALEAQHAVFLERLLYTDLAASGLVGVSPRSGGDDFLALSDRPAPLSASERGALRMVLPPPDPAFLSRSDVGQALRLQLAERAEVRADEFLAAPTDWEGELERVLPDDPERLERSWRKFGPRSVVEGVRRAGRWLARQWDRVKRFFRSLRGSGSPDPGEEGPVWRRVLQWLGDRLFRVLRGVARAGRAVGVWLLGTGRHVRVEGALVGGFELSVDMDAVVVVTPEGVGPVRAALEEQERAFRAATTVLGAVLRLVVDLALLGVSGGAMTWRLVLGLARSLRAAGKAMKELEASPAAA